jgi:hypothetical protein
MRFQKLNYTIEPSKKAGAKDYAICASPTLCPNMIDDWYFSFILSKLCLSLIAA